MHTPLTLLYTGGLRGDLDLLPRMYTLLRHLRAAEFEDEADVMLCQVQPSLRRTVLIDLGESCAPDVWHCAATGGRSALVVFDAMGYDAANVSGVLSPDDRANLASSVRLALVDGAQPYEAGGVQVSFQPGPLTRLDGTVLTLAAVRAGDVGVAQVSFVDGRPYLAATSIFPLPAGTPHDPTIAGTVDFVLSEARAFEKKHSRA